MTVAFVLGAWSVPAIIERTGDRAQMGFWEFFVSNIRNINTQRAHCRAIEEFLA